MAAALNGSAGAYGDAAMRRSRPIGSHGMTAPPCALPPPPMPCRAIAAHMSCWIQPIGVAMGLDHVPCCLHIAMIAPNAQWISYGRQRRAEEQARSTAVGAGKLWLCSRIQISSGLPHHDMNLQNCTTAHAHSNDDEPSVHAAQSALASCAPVNRQYSAMQRTGRHASPLVGLPRHLFIPQ